ncbi:MAG: hypothetical protein ACRECF_07350 [Methyloceanibacter sp.]
MKSAIFLILLVVALGLIAPMLGSCATYRGMQQDVHRMTNPNWRVR